MNCACCGIRPATQPGFGTGVGVSDAFSDLALWADPRGRKVCLPCGRNYQTKELRRYPHQTLDMVTWTQIDRVILRSNLAAPLPSGIAVTLPIGGQKHVWHHARHGAICHDNGTIPWGESEADAFRACLTLRDMGLTEGALTERELRWANLVKATQRTELVGTWRRWNENSVARPDLREVCVLASRPPKEPTNDD